MSGGKSGRLVGCVVVRLTACEERSRREKVIAGQREERSARKGARQGSSRAAGQSGKGRRERGGGNETGHPSSVAGLA